jgi:hypothetical protein
MKILGYNKELRGWQCDNGMILNMPCDMKEDDVLAEAERLETIANTPVEPPEEQTPEVKFNEAIEEYVAAGGKLEVAADTVVAKMEPAKAVVYLDEKAVEVKPEPKPDEKPAVHIRKDEKYALCGYFLGPYTWAFADMKQAQQEIDACGVVEICPKCLDLAGVK